MENIGFKEFLTQHIASNWNSTPLHQYAHQGMGDDLCFKKEEDVTHFYNMTGTYVGTYSNSEVSQYLNQNEAFTSNMFS